MADAPTHVPVLQTEVTAALLPPIRDVWVDCTVGLGGHAAIILDRTPPSATLIALDADPDMLAVGSATLGRFGPRVKPVRANFRDLLDVVHESGFQHVDAILADLGFNSAQIADPAKGLSFDLDGPLDMRLDPDLRTTAADLVNGLPEGQLADLLYVESQERHSRRIAKWICRARRESRIAGTMQLARIVASAVGGRPGRIHPATRTFMALRMAVNREGEALEALLRQAPALLRPGGRIAIISFHSGEDRRVKEDFRRRAADGYYELLTRRPVQAGESEIHLNPRSRSAKLRVAQRTELPTPPETRGR